MTEAEKKETIFFVYSYIHADYKIALRKRDSMRKQRIADYEKHLQNFRDIIKYDLKMDI